MNQVPQVSHQEFKDTYELKDILDRGTFSLVRKAVVRSTNELVAVKIVDTSNFPGAEGVVQRELEALMVVQHPNCIQMRAYCRNSNYVYIVVNLARGEVLVDWLQEKRQCTELETAIIVHGILQGVFYLHSNNIVHRDLKLDNLMFESPGDINSLKILDFGFSKVLQGTGDILQTICGSPQYIAPEILNITTSGMNQPIPYTQAVDLWSIGVIMYMLIAGYAPFDEDNEMKMYHKIIKGEFSFPSDPWDNVSNQAKELIYGLLNVDPMRRMTVPQAIASPFITKYARLYTNVPNSSSGSASTIPQRLKTT